MVANNQQIDRLFKIEEELDKFYESRDKISIKKLIRELRTMEPKLDGLYQIMAQYHIATSYLDLHTIHIQSKSEDIVSDGSCDKFDDAVKINKYFSKAIKCIERYSPEGEDIELFNEIQCRLYINYANYLDDMGRGLLAIEYYHKALEMGKKVEEACINLSIAYDRYSEWDYDEGHKYFIKLFAAKYAQESRNHKPLEISSREERRLIEMEIEKFSSPIIKIDDAEEKEYRHWCMRNKLLLNTLNDLPIDNLYYATDPLRIPNITTSFDSIPVIYAMYNQIKMEYIFSRYQLYLYYNKPDCGLITKDVCLIDSRDKVQYTIKQEQLKTSYKSLYGLLDKITILLNEYFCFGTDPHKIYFCKLDEMVTQKGFSNKPEYHDNGPLKTIVDISRDYKNEMDTNRDPKLLHDLKIKQLRDRLEHRFVLVYDETVDLSENSDGSVLHVSNEELETLTTYLLKLVRELLIYTTEAIYIHERNKTTGTNTIKRTLKEIEQE
ncbi:MAG: hypothetical protein PWQ62_1232 [Candidatus Methanomethylophilaceae archaeon]|nr:hypothetical protein [Candidatus Methanomethylophilaceae archaeon]